ncbi:MAG: VCBS repeat-containing protein, partial [Kofleriaceae bacterium]
MRVCWLCVAVVAACGGPGDETGDDDDDDGPGPLPPPSCMAASAGSATIAAPTLAYTLSDRFHEAWLASPAVADLDGDGTMEIVAPRDAQLIVWHADNTIAWRATLPGRIWSSPVVADLVPGSPGLEVAVAARGQIAAFDATGQMLPGFPFTWQDELRSLAAGDLDGNGSLELVAVTSTPLDANGQRDIVIALHGNGSLVAGFPPNTGGAAGCDDACYVTGGYDQNLAIGDVDG